MRSQKAEPPQGMLLDSQSSLHTKTTAADLCALMCSGAKGTQADPRRAACTPSSSFGAYRA